MHFAKISDIEQVREAIKDRPEFIEANREILTGNGLFKYTVFNYLVGHVDSFDCPIRRECRGLIFDEQGQVMSRRFHKFFNKGEKPETMTVDLRQPHVILDKLDGSMITPLVFMGTTVRWATKMGVTDIGEAAGRFANKNERKHRYAHFAIDCTANGLTPIFEYVSPTNRIVLPYMEENLILLAVRDNITGTYQSLDQLNIYGDAYGIPVVQPYSKSVDDLSQEIDIEGVVIRFDTGHMVKVKTEWYCAIHRAKENILFEKNVIQFILQDKLDDILPHLPQGDAENLEAYKSVLLSHVDELSNTISTHIDLYDRKGVTRKDFALSKMPITEKFLSSLFFTCWKKESSIREEVIRQYLKNLGSQNEVDTMRAWLPVPWSPVGAMS